MLHCRKGLGLRSISTIVQQLRVPASAATARPDVLHHASDHDVIKKEVVAADGELKQDIRQRTVAPAGALTELIAEILHHLDVLTQRRQQFPPRHLVSVGGFPQSPHSMPG